MEVLSKIFYLQFRYCLIAKMIIRNHNNLTMTTSVTKHHLYKCIYK